MMMTGHKNRRLTWNQEKTNPPPLQTRHPSSSSNFGRHCAATTNKPVKKKWRNCSPILPILVPDNQTIPNWRVASIITKNWVYFRLDPDFGNTPAAANSSINEEMNRYLRTRLLGVLLLSSIDEVRGSDRRWNDFGRHDEILLPSKYGVYCCIIFGRLPFLGTLVMRDAEVEIFERFVEEFCDFDGWRWRRRRSNSSDCDEEEMIPLLLLPPIPRINQPTTPTPTTYPNRGAFRRPQFVFLSNLQRQCQFQAHTVKAC